MSVTRLEPIAHIDNSNYKTAPAKQGVVPPGAKNFGDIFSAAVNLLNETNELQNKASAEEIKFSLGLSDNPHDVMIASQKASIALQYTNAIRTNFLQSYNTLMNMQI